MSLAGARPVAMISTKDRKTAEPLYGDALGLPSRGDDGFAALFDLDGVTLRLTEIPDYTPPAHPVLGWQVGDMEAAVASLAANGVVMNIYPGMGQDENGIWTAPDGSAKVAFFNDPDGNGLSLTQVL